MPEDIVVVFEPKHLGQFDGHSNPEDVMLDRIIEQHSDTLSGQLRIFPYITKMQGIYVYKTTGFMYTQGGEDNPLSNVDGSIIISRMDNLSVTLAGDVIASQNRGKLSIRNPTDEFYKKCIDMGLLSTFEHLGLESPPEVRKFILNLDEGTFSRLINPHLAYRGYHNIVVKKVE